MTDFKKNKQLYTERVKRMQDAADNKEPDRIPVCSFIESYALAYAGTTIDAVFCDGHVENARKIMNSQLWPPTASDNWGFDYN